MCHCINREIEKTLSNYRPIALTSIFSKIIENVIKIKLTSHISRNKLVDNYQYGYKQKNSTLCATLDLINCITDFINMGNIVIAIFIDLQKAFDLVQHEILLYKTEGQGIQGNTYKLIKTFLEDRKQYTSINNKKSNSIFNKYENPQEC